jgi:PLP dependent protein
MPAIKDHLSEVRDQLALAAKASGRSPSEICLLAVSKTFPASDIRLAYDAGQRCFGENYVQEGIEKIADLSDLRDQIEWHFIGPLQSNKTKLVSENFDWVHSIDRLKIAQRLNEQRPKNFKPLNVCIQVNISEENSKSGVNPNEVLDLCLAISQMPMLRLRGLMSIPEPTDDEVKQRAAHHLLYKILQNLKNNPQLSNSRTQLDTLSMGMSSDMKAAIQEGSTMVRIGTAIFGKRNYI